MAHNIHRDAAGKDWMFVVGKREDAWHQLGQRCDNAATWEQAMQLAGLDWEVVKLQLWARNPLTNAVMGGCMTPSTCKDNCKCQRIPSYAIFRKTDGQYLGTVGEQFTIKQSREIFTFVDDLLQASGGAHYDSAGALGNGSIIWVSARVPAADINVLGVDPHQMYLGFSTGHAGEMAHTPFLSSTRVVCQNTLRSALSSATGILRFKHTKNQDAKFAEAKRKMDGVVMDAKALQTKLDTLAKRRVTKKSLITILDRLFPKPEDAGASTAKRDNIAAMVLGLFDKNDNNAIPQIRGTAYNVLNAVTEYTDHYRSARITNARAGYSETQARAENAVIGTGERLKSTALAVIEEVTANDPVYDPTSVALDGREITEDEFRRMMGDEGEGAAA